jgi:hypothetical protein
MSITSLIGSDPTSCIQLLTDLDKNPGDAQRPIAEVLYEALQAAYPCG